MIKGHSLRYYISGNEGTGPRPPRMENDTMAEEESMAYELQDEFESKARGFGKGIIIIGAAGFVIWWLMTILPTYF